MYVVYVLVWLSAISDFFFQAEDGIRVLVRSRGLGDVYKRQGLANRFGQLTHRDAEFAVKAILDAMNDALVRGHRCLLSTSDAADDLHCVDLGGRRLLKKKNN